MNRTMTMLAAALLCASTLPCRAALKTEEIEYKQGDTVLKGFLAYDDAVEEKRPGVLVVHEWWGLNDYAKGRASQLVGLGYVALALDTYGNGKKHSFTNPAADKVGMDALAYNEPADRRSWAAMKSFLEEALSR